MVAHVHWDGVADLFVLGGGGTSKLPVVGEGLDAGVFMDG